MCHPSQASIIMTAECRACSHMTPGKENRWLTMLSAQSSLHIFSSFLCSLSQCSFLFQWAHDFVKHCRVLCGLFKCFCLVDVLQLLISASAAVRNFPQTKHCLSHPSWCLPGSPPFCCLTTMNDWDSRFVSENWKHGIEKFQNYICGWLYLRSDTCHFRWER